jgi:hypothetical protein
MPNIRTRSTQADGRAVVVRSLSRSLSIAPVIKEWEDRYMRACLRDVADGPAGDDCAIADPQREMDEDAEDAEPPPAAPIAVEVENAD